MFVSPRAKSWEKRGGGGAGTLRADIAAMAGNFRLDTVIDSFRPHPVTQSTVVIPGGLLWERRIRQIMAVVREQKLAMVNYGLVIDGIAVTFRNVEDAALFKIFFDSNQI